MLYISFVNKEDTDLTWCDVSVRMSSENSNLALNNMSIKHESNPHTLFYIIHICETKKKAYYWWVGDYISMTNATLVCVCFQQRVPGSDQRSGAAHVKKINIWKWKLLPILPEWGLKNGKK